MYGYTQAFMYFLI